MRGIVALVVMAALAGCQTNEDGSAILGVPGSPAWMATASPSAKAAHYGQTCAAYGFKAGTPEMAQCIQIEVSGQRAENAMMQPIFAPKPRVTCTSQRPVYGQITTVCQ